jgi:hypothetical protein
VIQSSSKAPLLVTTLLMLFIYQLAFLSLTFSFGLLGIKGSSMEDSEETEVKNEDLKSRLKKVEACCYINSLRSQSPFHYCCESSLTSLAS